MTSETTAPKQRLVVLDEYCTRAAGSDCARCASCCPKDAITLPEGANAPVVDHSACNGCGICFGVCDAFASTRMTNFDLHARIRRIAEGGQRAYITCNENVFPGYEVDTHVVVLPCLSMISPELWTLLLAEGIRITIACDLKYCEDCDRGGAIGAELFARSIQIAETRTGGKVLFTFRIPEKQKILEKYAENSTSDRRTVFTGFASDAANIASGKRRLRNSAVLRDYYERKERHKAAMRLHLASENPYKDFVPEGHVRRLMFPKQQLVLEAVEAMPEAAQNIPVAVSVTDVALCQQHGACATSCPTGARALVEGALRFDEKLCVGCGICVDACPSFACSVEETTAEIYLDTSLEAEADSEPVDQP